ncbi:MAG: response regulator [Fibromonadales bacterium]|nr:response regulator [Fibromonadales bacterium]MCL2260861.1 response regulator [Fibromonadales bacterium]
MLERKDTAKVIFVVDDSAVNLIKAKQALESQYDVFTMLSAAKMFSLLERFTPDLVLLDIEMPEMDGFTALQKLRENELTAQIPVIFLTAFDDESREFHGLELGAVDFIAKPFSTPIMLRRISNHLHVQELIKKRTERIEQLQNNVVFVLADMVENRDKVTSGHVERTCDYIRLLIEGMQERGLYMEEMDGWNKEMLVYSARLHDIGKISVSDLILNKPAKLTPEEFEAMKTHSREGERIINQIIARTGEGMFLRHAKFFAGYHHEHWSGAGYHRGLKGLDIPLQGRIMAIADVYDAITSERPYKKAFTHEEAVKIIMDEAGKQFDPKIVEVFLAIQDKFKSVKDSKAASVPPPIQHTTQ